MNLGKGIIINPAACYNSATFAKQNELKINYQYCQAACQLFKEVSADWVLTIYFLKG